MGVFQPKYITFDCYGTLIRMQFPEMARKFYSNQLTPDRMEAFLKDWSGYRLDEVLGDWKPYAEVLGSSLERCCRKWGLDFRRKDAAELYEAVPTWGPHEDVPGGLSKIGSKIPMVILSNAMDDQIQHNVPRLGAPFHAVYTAQQAQAYKPRFQAFEYMFDQLGCDPKDIMHVSSSFRYDQNPATDLGIGTRVFVGRGHEPSNPFYRDVEIPHIGCLPALVGL